MNPIKTFKNWSKSDKKALAYILACTAYCAVVTGLCIKEKDTKCAAFMGTCTLINTASATKVIRDAQQKAKERN